MGKGIACQIVKNFKQQGFVAAILHTSMQFVYVGQQQFVLAVNNRNVCTVAILPRKSLGGIRVSAVGIGRIAQELPCVTQGAFAVVQICCYLENQLRVMPLFCGALALARSQGNGQRV